MGESFIIHTPTQREFDITIAFLIKRFNAEWGGSHTQELYSDYWKQYKADTAVEFILRKTRNIFWYGNQGSYEGKKTIKADDNIILAKFIALRLGVG